MLTVHDIEGPSGCQWAIVIRGMRNSWESWEKGDSTAPEGEVWPFALGNADAALCRRLIAAGSDHAKFLRQLPILADVTAPEYWWKEFDQYRIGVTADDVSTNSTSMMHVLGRQPFTPDMFSFEDLEPDTVDDLIAELNRLRYVWQEAGKRKGPDAGAWRAMLQAIPQSWNYRRCVSLNYQAARAIYHARRSHRLAEWRTFCEALAGLEYGWLITDDTP